MLDFISYIRKRWQENSSSNGQKGTTIDELAVKPTGIVLSGFYNKLVDAKRINDITKYDTMSDGELDAFGGKFFMPRQKGNTASTIVRIRFNEKKNVVISSNVIAVSSGGATFSPTKTMNISKNSFVSSEDNFSLFYIDVMFVATSPGSTFNVSAGAIVRLDNASFDYISVSNPNDVINGSKYESNKEYAERLKYSINDRSLMNKAGMYALLRQQFPVVSSVNVQGAGSKYMTRDLVDAVSDESAITFMDFLGKTSGSNSVKHSAASYIFPPKPGTAIGAGWGPHSSKSDYGYPLTIAPITETYKITQSSDAAMFGYDTQNEYTNDEYSGIYFNDYNNTAGIETTDLLNIRDEGIPYTKKVASPNSEWVVGAHGRSSGDFGSLKKYINSGDLLSFKGTEISLSSGTGRTICAGRPVTKRTGVKASGKFRWPIGDEAYISSNLNVILGGVDSNISDAFSGIGFGVMVFKGRSSTGDNAVAYFTNSAKYSDTQVFASKGDNATTSGVINIAGTSALYEQKIAITPGANYDFEFVVDDDLKLTLYLAKETPDALGNLEEFRLELPSDVLKVFSDKNKGGIYSLDSQYYGTTAKVSLSTNIKSNDYKWVVKDLKVVDTNNCRATSLLSFDVTELNEDAVISLRAFAKGYLNNGEVEGYTAYVWDKEGQNNNGGGTGILSSGAWSVLSGISNQSGSKTPGSGLLQHTIRGIDRYTVKLNNGKRVYIMLVSNGSSYASMKYHRDFLGDVNSRLSVDYVKLESVNKNKFHTKNKADVYVVTVRSSELPTAITREVTYSGGYAELSESTGFRMPISSIKNVTVNKGTNYESILSTADYTVYTPDYDFKNSRFEKSRLVLNTSFEPDSVTVEYSPYPDVDNIQDSFDGGDNDKVYGDIVVKHSFAVYLDFNIQFTGSTTKEDLISAIWKYVDDNNSGTLSISEMVRSLYSSQDVNNIKEPLVISYERALDDSYKTTGVFDRSLSIRDIEYFIVRDLTVERM